jgi:hypothetical protein
MPPTIAEVGRRAGSPQFFATGSATIRDLSVLDVEQGHDIVLVNRRLVDYIMPR